MLSTLAGLVSRTGSSAFYLERRTDVSRAVRLAWLFLLRGSLTLDGTQQLGQRDLPIPYQSGTAGLVSCAGPSAFYF